MGFRMPPTYATIAILLPVVLAAGLALLALNGGDRGGFGASDPAFTDTKGFKKLGRPRPGEWLHSHPETRQSFKQYCEETNRLPSMGRNTINILPFGEFPREDSPDLDLLKRFAECYFMLPVKLLPRSDLPKGETRRRSGPNGEWTQYRIEGFNRILLDTDKGDDCLCILGVTMVDIYPDDKWNFVFGQASLGGYGIFSFARYRPAFYNHDARTNERDARLLTRRSLAVLAHETGHMMGITHCVDFNCLMCGSNSLAESDRRPFRLCPHCLRKLAWYLRFDVRERYRKLAAFYDEVGINDEAEWIRDRLKRIGPRAD